MDQVLADTLSANLKSARTAEEVQRAMTLAVIALVDCQRKTADRVKELVLAKDAADVRRAAVVWVGRAMCGFAAAGGFAGLVKLFKCVGWL